MQKAEFTLPAINRVQYPSEKLATRLSCPTLKGDRLPDTCLNSGAKLVKSS